MAAPEKADDGIGRKHERRAHGDVLPRANAAQEVARMRQRQELDDVAHEIWQRVRRKERTAEERHRQQDVRVDLPHFLIRVDLHGREKADFSKDGTVQHEHEQERRRQKEMRAERQCEHEDDGRRNQAAQHGREDFADDESRRPDRRDDVLFEALVIDAL